MNPGDTNRPVGADSLPTASEIAPAELSAPVTNAEQFDRWLDQHSDSLATDPNRIYNPADPGDNGLRINVSKFVLIVIGLIFVLSAGSLGAYAAYNAVKGQPKSGQQGDLGSVQANILLDTSGRNLHINYDTTITDGRNFEATGDVLVQNQSVQAFKVQDTGGSNIMVADTKNKTIMIGDKPPGQVSLKVNGDITVNGALVSTDSGYSLSGQGLSIGGVLVCTANGCVSSSSPAPTPASPTIDVANLAYLNKTNNFSGINKFTAGGNVFVGDGSGLSALNAGSVSSGTLSDSRLSANVTKNNGNNTFSGSNTFSAQIQAAAGINSVTGYSVNGTAGGSFSCAANQLLQQAVVSGGIITSGTCVVVAGGSTPTLQDVYDASAPANVVLSGASGVFSIQDAASPLATNLFEVGSNGNSTLYFAVNNLGISVTGNVNTTGQYQVGGVQISSANLSNDANLAKLNANQTFSGNNTFSSVSNSFTGNGAGLTSLNASNISSGTLSDTRLSNNVALLNALQTFTGQNTFSNVSNSFTGNGSGLTSLNASNVSSGTLNDARLSANVTLQGNTFNGASQLVQLTAGGILPVLNGSNLTSLNASNISSGTLADARLSSNVALLNANNIFLGNNSFHLNSTALSVQDAATPLGTDLFQVTDSTGTTKYFEVSASGVKINGNDACTTAGNCTGVSGGAIGGSGTAGKIAKFTGSGFTIGDSLLSESGTVVTVGGSINIATGNTYQINGTQISSAVLSNDANLAKLDGTQTFSGTNTFSNASNSFTGNGAGLTSLNASNISSGTLNDARLSSNVALKNANNTFIGNNVFSLNTAGLAVQDALTPLGTNLFEITNNAGTTKYFTVSATALQFNGNDVCTTAGNCTGVSGGAIGGSGTAGKIAKFTGSGFTIGDSLISDNGTAVTVGGVLSVNTITPTATLTVGTPTQTLTLQGDASTSLSAKGVSFTNTLVFAAPAVASHTITIPNASGTVAVSASGPLSLDAAGNLTCPSCLTTNGTGGGSGVSSVNSLTGALTLAGTANQVVITPSANTLTFSIPQDIATTSSPTFANINVASGGLYEVNGVQISSSALSNDTNLAKLDGTQTFSGANTFSNASNSFTGDGSSLTSLNASNVASGTLNDLRLSGNVPLKNAANTFTNTNTFQTSSATAFQVQSAAAAETLLTVDSSARSVSGGNLIKIGNSTGTDTATTILVVDSATTAPTSNLGALNGGLFYNSTTGHINVIEGGAVKELCNKTDLGCGSAPTTTLQNAYDNSSSPATITTSSTAKGIIFKAGSGFDSASLFQVQNSGGQQVLNVSTTTNSVSIPQGNLTVSGLSTPNPPSLSSSATGGTLAAATYYYQVTAVNSNGTTPATPSNPASVTTSGTTSQNTLTWTAVTNASSYNVYRSTNGTTWFKNNVPSSTTSIVDNGTNYSWSTSAGLPTANTTGGNLTVNGAATFANLVNSTSALDVQDATGDSILRVDSTDRFIGINNATPAATLDVVASPPAPNFSFGFENGTLGAFSQTGPCAVSATFAHTGSYGWGNGASQDCTLTLTRSLASAGTITFWAKYFTAPPNPNEVKFRIDGANTLTTNGTVGWTQFTYAVSAGTHTFNWITGQSVYGEYLYVDDVSIVPNASSSTAALFNGGNVGIGTAAPNATLETDGTALFKAASGSDSTTLFQIQNAAGTSILNVDSTNLKVALNQSNFYVSDLSSPTSPAVVAGANTGGSLSGAAGTTYYYKVTALNAAGESLASSEVSINGQSFTKLGAPAAPTGSATTGSNLGIGSYLYKLTVVTANGETTAGTESAAITTTSGNQSVNLTLPAVPTGATGYKVYRTAVGGAANSELLLTAGGCSGTISATSCTDSATDAQRSGSAPASNTATTNVNKATVSWAAVTGATSYRIYRGTASGAESAYQISASSPFTDTGAAGTAATVPTRSTVAQIGVGTAAPSANLDVEGTALFKNILNTSTAFQIQNAAGNSVLSVDTVANQTVLGSSSSLNGTLSFANNAGANTVSLVAQASNPASSVTIQLPTVGASASGQCVISDTGSTTTNSLLKFSTCPSGPTSQTKVVAMGTATGCTGSSPVASLDTNADYVVTSCTSAQTTINTAITALGGTGGTVYLKEGTYIIDGQINMASNVTLMGSGQSTIIKIKDSSAINAIAASSKTRIAIRNLVLDGNRTNQVSNIDALEFSTLGSGSGTTAVPGVKIDNVTIQNFNGPSTVNAVTVINSSFTNSWFINNGKVLLSGSSYLNFSNNKVMGSGSFGIHLNGGSNNTISGNTIQGSNNNDIQIDSNATNNVISGNTISGGTRGFEVDASAVNNIISNNTITGTSGNGMNLSGATKNTVTGNTINGSGGDGINAASADYSTITGNTISGNGANGINIQSNHLTVSGNDISSNNTEGIYINGNGYNDITGNKLYNNGSFGRSSIKLDANSSNNLIANNLIFDSVSGGKPAILIFQSSDTNNTLSNNIFSGGAGSISDSGTNTIYSSQMTSSTTGFVQRVGSDSASAFQLQNANGTTLLNLDTTNSIFSLFTDNANHTIHIGDGGTSGAGTFPSTAVLDNFNRANGVLTLPWVGMNNSQMYINTNAAAAGPASGRWQSRYEGSGPFTDSEAYATLAVLDDWQLVGVRVQQTTAGSGLNSGYYAQYGGGTFNITKKVNNVETNLGTMSLTLAAGDKIGIRVIGNTITAYSYQSGAWTLRLTATDSTFASGYLAMEQGTANSSQTGRLDDFGGGNIANAIQAITIGSTNLGSNLNLQAGSGNINLTSAASTIVKPTQNSSTAFQVQNAGGASLFTVDTSNNQITLGSASATPVLLILGNKNTSGDPTCTNGAIYYNSSFNQLRACVNGGWTSFGNNDGWVFDGDQTWTYASSTSFTVSGDQTGTFTPGTRIKLTQSATVEYFVVTSSSYSSPNTTVNITGGSDYTLANSAISANAHSYAANPQGYPDWFNYTPSFVGWSANPTGTIKFSITGHTCTVVVIMATGTSNSTTTSMSLPVSPVDSGNDWLVRVNNNGLMQEGLVENSGATLNIYKDVSGGLFSASGTKWARFTILFQF